MNDNQILALIISILDAGLATLNMSSVEVLQNYQATQQGIPEGDAIYIHKLPEKRYGSPQELSTFNESTNVVDQTTTFYRVTTWQIATRAQQDPSNVSALTASDLADTVADILQFMSTRQTLLASGVGIDRITNIRTVYEVNEKGRNEQVPNFDITLNYRKIYNSTVAAAGQIEQNLTGIG